MMDHSTDIFWFSLALGILSLMGTLPLWVLLVAFALMVIVCFIDLAELLALFLDRF